MKCFYTILIASFLAINAFSQPHKTSVDFGYSFGEPHRLAVCLPNSSNKTMLDAYSDTFYLLWTYQNCTNSPLGSMTTYGTPLKANCTANVDGTRLKGVKWQRVDNYIPAFEYVWEGKGITVTANVVATDKGDVLTFKATNHGSETKNVVIDCNMRNMSFNMRWWDNKYKYNTIVPINGQNDRILFIDTKPAERVPSGRQTINVDFKLKPGEQSSHSLVRPYNANIDDQEKLLQTDWDAEASKGLQVWRNLIAKAPKLTIPDSVAYDAFKACLADMFVLREKQSDGKMAGLCGTDVYRSPNSFEPEFQAMAMANLGYFQEAKENIEFVSQFIEPNGDWNDYRQWNRAMWAVSGYKSYYTKQYYLLTHDKQFLQEQFPKMLASSRWSAKQRELTKAENNPDSPLWGLMPRGFGDCGLKDGEDYFGVFYPHNIIHCMGLEANAWAAKELGRMDVYKELQDNYLDLLTCIKKSLEKGAIRDSDGTCWIPGVPGKTSGSSWGVAEAIYPARIVTPDSPLAIGTMKHLQKTLSEGGLPENLGWFKGGLWVAISLDALAYVDIIQGNADLAASYYYAALNHGTPLFSWCEERMPEKGTDKTGGDRQHAWTPISITRFTRDMLVMEDDIDGSVWLTRAVPRWWYGVGEKIGVENMPTRYGEISYLITRTSEKEIKFQIELKDYDLAHPLKLELRLPEVNNKRYKAIKVVGAKCKFDKNCTIIAPNENRISGSIYILSK
jgi:hypothetical protein